jgi:hypothetical protein
VLNDDQGMQEFLHSYSQLSAGGLLLWTERSDFYVYVCLQSLQSELTVCCCHFAYHFATVVVRHWWPCTCTRLPVGDYPSPKRFDPLCKQRCQVLG